MSDQNQLTPKEDSLLQQWLRRKKSTKKDSFNIGHLPEGTPAPLSLGQQRLWLLQQMYPKNPFYHHAEGYHFRGKINLEKLIDSFKHVVQRHDILRTTFATIDGQAIQQVHQEPRIDLASFNLQDLSGKTQEEEAKSIILSEASRPFNLEQGPLVRVSLLQLTEQDLRLIVTMHHMITDLWSRRLLREEWSNAYQGKSGYPPLECQYADYSWWQRNQSIDAKHLAYWEKQLGGELPILTLPHDQSRPQVPTFEGALVEQSFSTNLSKKLQALSKQAGTTMFVIMLSIYKVLLHRYSGQVDILVGAPITTRDHTSLESLIGFFNDTIVLRTDLSGNPRFLDLVEQVRTTVLDAFSHKKVPFESLVKALKPDRQLSTNPLFQVMFFYNTVPPIPTFSSDLELECEHLDVGVAKFDLTLYFSEDGDNLSANIEYASDLFEHSTIARMEGHLRKLMEGIVENPQQRINDLPMLTEVEREQILLEWNNTTIPQPKVPCIHHLIESQAKTNQHKTAVIYQGQPISYGELNQRADLIAGHLVRREIGPGNRIGLCTERSHEMIIGIVGILKSGAAYVPLDPQYPIERIQYMTRDAGIPIIVTEGHLVHLFNETPVTVLTFDESNELPSDAMPLPSVTGEDTAYIIYTSGSTGQPKGVPISHHNLIQSTSARSYYPNQPGVFLLLSSFGFDSSVAGIFWTLCTGGTLVLSEPRIEQDLEGMARLIAEQNVTHTLLLPSIYDLLLQYASTSLLSSLNTVIVAGERCPSAVCRRHFEKLSEVNLYNEYGPTEATVWSTVHHVQPENGEDLVPIGRPIPSAQTYILNTSLKPVPIGVAGELFVGGAGVAQGYLNRLELTKSRFIKSPFSNQPNALLYKTGDLARYLSNGEIQFLGRIDNQVKIRGYRIEPEEIQEVLMSYKGIKEALVMIEMEEITNDSEASIPDETNSGQSPGRIIGYVAGMDDLDLEDVRKYTKAKLPEYMVPVTLQRLDNFPRLPNGKLDLRAFPTPEKNRKIEEVDFAAPRSVVEKQLTQIWESVLNFSPVSIHHNFFEIGGDSILSIQVISRARKAGLVLAANKLFEHQTIAELALFVQSSDDLQQQAQISSGPALLTPIQHWFFEVHHAAPHYWNQAVHFEIPDRVSPETAQKATEQIVKRHDALRLAFQNKEGHWMAEIKPSESISSFQRIGLSDCHPDLQPQEISKRLKGIQENLNLENGSLFQCIYIEYAGSQNNQLMLLAHHLVVDAVSWGLLIEEFSSLVQSVSQGEEISMTSTTTPYTVWSNYLSEYAKSDRAAKEMDFWRSQTQALEMLPADYEVLFPIVERSVKILTSELVKEQSKRLMEEASKAYNMRTDEMLITALMLALRKWVGVSELCLGLERHGRELLDEELDFSNSVGWFTTYFPIRVSIDQSNDLGMTLRSVKEQLRQTPHGGLGYGVLRYLGGYNELTQQPVVLFNYLGTIQGLESPVLGRGEFIDKDIRDPLSERYYQLEINCIVRDGKLQTQWSYSQDHYKASSIEDLIAHFDLSLQDLIDHCNAIGNGGYTPSDFPEADLSQDDLDRLVNQLDS